MSFKFAKVEKFFKFNGSIINKLLLSFVLFEKISVILKKYCERESRGGKESLSELTSAQGWFEIIFEPKFRSSSA